MKNNELQQHKKSETVKWILTLIAFVLVGVLLCGIILGWFEKKEVQSQTDEQETVVTDEDGNELKTDGTAQAMPQKMVFGARSLSAVSAVAERAASVTLTAKINPANADNQAVDWQVSWKNATSEWATGKSVSEYMTVTPSSDGALTATVNCLRAFGEQIKITVVSRENTSATAECTCDYVKRISGISVKLNEGTKSVTTIKIGGSVNYTTGYTVSYGDGTITPNAEISDCHIQMTESFLSAVQAYNQYLPTTVTAAEVDATSFTADNAFLYALGGNLEAIKTSLSTLYIGGIRSAIKNVSSSHATLSVTVSIRYGNIVNESKTQIVYVKFNDDAMTVRVQSVELDRSTLAV
ncbi:MAG: hypothetical protein NC548_35500 [Lachnospiraceae bacterium]|nr:hypothetical protein [Lachnospiraceae bacterium]